MSSQIEPSEPSPLSGDEPLGSSGMTVRDFWSWGFSDLRQNVNRGILAEFLVAKAVGAGAEVRHAWDDFDVLAPDGTRIEVKSAGYLQSWSQKQLSRISFSGLRAREWDEETGQRSGEETFKADVYVFALQTTRDPDRYDMTDLDSWRFHVLPVATLRELDCSSISLATLTRHGFESCPLGDLAEAIREAVNEPR